ncbi:MAG: hypothetical protein HFE85_00360, partial [Clostridiales bacterium]|nr:hypothetical protein [Clostridiales bacterium]
MTGKGIQKFAGTHRLTMKNGVAFGNYRGYLITLYEGMGWKSAAFAVDLR